MRIGFVADAAYPWFRGGMEKRRFLIAQALKGAGHEVHIFTMFREGMPGMEFAYKGIHYHCVGKAIPAGEMYKNGRRNIRWPLKFAALLDLKLWNYKFDVIDTDSFPFLHIPKVAAYAHLTGAKFIVTWHEVWDRAYWQKYLPGVGLLGYVTEKLSAVASKRKFAVSSATKQGLIDVLNAPESNITLFPAAISKAEMSALSKGRKPGKSDKFIAIGRLVPEKRIDIAIRAVAGTSAKLTVVGSGPEKQKLSVLAKKLGASGRIKFVETIAPNRLMREVSESRALLMFSAREGMSIVSVEALALGTPVIITKSTSLPSEIRRYCHAIDEKDLGGSLGMLLKNKKSVLYRKDANRREILERFSAEKGIGLYERLAADAL
ncbi:MAG: glycosyltransferase family 4 protein [Candidatus Micrarchaeota archaeon]|nr:glycosyltransferase family 4 protein [Candidatus Micrarchaeota archaeon]